MRMLKYGAAVLVLLLLVAAAALWGTLRASLPRLDGSLALPGLAAPVRITRDARGVPTLEAANRADLAFATGFVHAQDRFFQMDLSRRLAAGELAELFGAVALPQDRRTRVFRFRTVATQVLAQASATERALLDAYARGVNLGLAELGARPWEYLLLGQPPAPWRVEDTILVEHAMWWDLQSGGLQYEILRQQINARLGGAECGGGWKCALGFLYPPGTSWDAALLPGAGDAAVAAVPGVDVLNVRGAAPAALAPAPLSTAAVGSNNWAVAGSLTANGAALLANDMHLGLRVPPVWYHARLRLPAAGAAALDLNGVMLPGAPLLVAGSNGHIAWGYTNSYGTWFSVTNVACTGVGARELTGPAGAVPLTVVREKILVHGAPAEELEVKSGSAGVLLRVDEAQHSCWFGSWLAQDPAATNLGLMALEGVTSVADAVVLAPGVGIPHQNAVIVDAQGHIAWTIFGRIPQDTGPTRARAVSAWTTAADHPRIVDPPLGRIWSANARVAADAHQLELIGGDVARFGAGYNLGARAGQIRDDLLALRANVTPADMLQIQLDDRALFLARWRTLLLELLDPPAVADHPRRAEFRQLIENWDARAGVDSVGYRLVRAYRDETAGAAWGAILAALQLPADAQRGPPEQFEGPLWQLLTARPLHLLPAAYPDWPAFLRAQVDATIAALEPDCPQLERCTWGARNTVRIRHPLSRALPWVARFLDMPSVQLPGDHDMPRVQDGTSFGASERFAVSPGHESEGYLLLPGGQSGHPLSPYYRAGFEQWARGQPLPFLPGPAEHTLTLTPR
jgi:penicillin G amidase